MKYLSLSICFFILSSVSYAQNYEIREVVELQNDLTARIKNVEDNNGNACALVRVDIPSVKGIHFDSSIVGDPEYLPGEYNVYIPEGAKNLVVDVNDKRYEINFSEFNISIEGKKCYRVVFNKAIANTKPQSNVIITANYDNAVVLIDGVPVGQTPLTLDNISLGQHDLSIPNTFGVTMKDTVINITGDNIISLTLHKEKKKGVYVDMVTSSGDTAGWYMVFGTNVKEQNGKKGLVDYAGNILIPFEYDYIFPAIQNGYYIVTKNEKQGLYDPGKGLVVPCIYDGFLTDKSYTHDSYMPVCIEYETCYKWGVLSPTGELIIPVEFMNYPHCYKDVIQVEKKGIGYGLFSYDGQPIINPKYDTLNPFINGYAIFCNRNKDGYTLGLVDIYGNEKIIPPKYTTDLGDATIFSSGLFRVKNRETGKWGYMDKDLNLVIPTIYDGVRGDRSVLDFNQGIVSVSLNGDVLVLNNKGDVILNPKERGYKKISYITDKSEVEIDRESVLRYEKIRYILVENNEKKEGLIDLQGNVVFPCKYSSIWRYVDGDNEFFELKDNESIYLLDGQKQLLFTLPLQMSIYMISDGFVMIGDKESYGYLNCKGEVLANCIYGSNFGEELIDDDYEEESSDEVYDIAMIIDDQPISEGLAILSIGDRFGFIDNKGTVKVPVKYTAVTPFENGIAFVRDQNGKWMRIFKKDL